MVIVYKSEGPPLEIFKFISAWSLYFIKYSEWNFIRQEILR